LLVVSLMAAVLVAVPPSVSAQTDPPPEPAPKGDIVFVVDESRSMAGDIADVRARIGDVIAQLDAAGVDARIGVVGYSAGNRIYTPLTEDSAAITAGVGMLAANRGNPEAGFSATVTAMSDAMGFRDDAASCQVLISDEDADVTTAYPQTKADALAALRARDAAFFAAVLSSGQYDYGPQPASLAAETLGATFDLLAFRADAGPVLEALIADCITKIRTSQPLTVDAGPDVSSPEGSVVSLDGTATSSVQGIEDRGRYSVDARSNIFAAGQGSPTAAGGVLPVEVDAMVPGTKVTFSGASGATYATSGCTGTAYPPDGTGSGIDIGATGGISGLEADDRQMLVGVFIGEGAPGAPAPVQLNFDGTRTEFANLRPAIGQTFMIGDGLSPAGVRHSFEVPPGATRLFLGLVTTNYNTMCGAYEIDVATSTGPAPITYSWEVLSASGPPIQLSSTAAEDPSFAVFDDGTYRLRLTATDGVETASDETTVTVTNQNPVLSAVESDASATDGLVEITATYSDPGPFDTHNLSIDWGDGTPTETVPVQAGGTGWGYGYAGHPYAALGTPTVTVSVVDDNGGTSAPQTVTVDVGGAGQGEPNPAQPAALFAASTADSEAIRVSGSGNAVTGLSHSNAGIRVSGSGHAFVGGTQYATTLTVQGSGSTFDPAAVLAPAGGFPFEFVWADYQPVGRAATAAGAAYHQIASSECKGGKWKPATPLAAGLYVVPCGVQISGSDVAGNVTIVASGDIKVSGSGDNFVPFIDGLLFYSTSTGSRAVDLSGSGHRFDGAMFAPTGGIEVTGSGNQLGCGIMGQTARVSGSNNQIAGVDCRGNGSGEGTTVSIAAPPIVVPTLDLSLAADKATALPGETITYTNTLRNGLADPAAPGSATLLVPALVGVDSHDAAPVTVGDVVYTLEVHDTVTGEWHTWASTDPAAPAEQRHVTLTGRPTPSAGVAYASDGYAGTVVDPGAIASWASAATVRLTGDQTAAMLDPARIDAVRNTITIATDRPLVRKIARFDDDPLGAIRTPPAADTTDNTIALTRPAGDPVTFDTAAVPDLAALTPGAAATGTATATVPQPEPAAAGETDAAYLARLDAADGQALFGAAYGTGTARVGGLFANQQLAATSVQVPIVTADLAVPTQIAAGSDIPISLTLTNTGSTTATDIAATVDVAGHGTLTLAGLPAELAPGATATGTTSIPTTAGTTTTYATTATLGWSHPGGTPGLYGPLHPAATTVAKPPVALDVVKYDNPDVIEDGIDYVIVATNTGTNTLTGVTVVDPIDANATLVGGTAATTVGTLTSGADPADRDVVVDVGTVAPGASVTIGFQVDYALAAPDTTEIVNQATVTSTELGDVLSDDPSQPGTADANTTPVTPPASVPGGGGPGGTNNGPTLEGCTPADGATVAAPTQLACTLIPRDGTTVSSWAVSIAPVGGTAEEAVPLGAGSGPAVSGLIDPTILANGVGNITIVAEDDDNGRSTLRSSVIIDGGMKLGEFSTSYLDLVSQMEGLPFSFTRSYSTTERNRSSDFGYGWDLDVSSLEVRANRPIGQGGWEQYDCGVAVFIVTRCYQANAAHYVTVTWPDGRTETFDATPAESPPAFNFLTSMTYTGRPGTSSRLEPAPGDEWAMFIDNGNGDSSLYRPLTADLYRPERFVLVARDGARYLIDQTSGLVSAELRDGIEITVAPDGITSSNGQSIDITRDAAGRIERIVGVAGETIDYSYDGEGNLVTVAPDGGIPANYGYEDHFLTTIDDQGRSPIRTLRYEQGRLVEIVDTSGNSTMVASDLGDHSEVRTSPTGLVTIVAYDPAGNVSSVEDAFDGESRTYSFEWNERRQVTKLVDPLQHEVAYTYESTGDLSTVRDGNDGVWDVDHTAFGERTRIESPDGTTIMAASYDDGGNITEITTNGVHRSIGYLDGRAATITDPEGRTVDIRQSADGLPTGAGIGPLDYEIGLDEDAGTVTLSNAEGGTLSYAFDPEGRVTSLANGASTYQFGYDPTGRIDLLTDPLSAQTEHTYNAAGQIEQTIDRNDDPTTYDYDAFGRVEVVEFADGDTLTYEYDGLGRVIAVQDDDSRVERILDLAGREVSVTTTGRGALAGIEPTTVSYEYDANGLVTSMTSEAGTIEYVYDAGYNVERVVDIDSSEIVFGHDEYGRITSIARPNGVTTSVTYTPSGRFDRIEHEADAAIVDFVDYTYDPVTGLVTGYTDGDGTHLVTHDDAGQVTAVDHPGARPDEAYSYDTRGNRIGSGQTYDAGHRLTSDADAAYDYDAEGRVVSVERAGEDTSYAWDGRGSLASVDGPDGQAEWHYDALGRPLVTDDASGRHQLVHDASGNLLAELDGAGALTASYSPGPTSDLPLTMRTGGDELWFHHDAVGTVTAVSGTDGDIVESYRYDAFGTPQQTPTVDQPFGFGARPWDPTSNTYDMRARRYEPSSGRYLSQDPLIGANPYVFAVNDPFSATDPSGLMALSSSAGILNKSARIAAAVLYLFVVGTSNGTDAGKWIETLAGIGGNFAAGSVASQVCAPTPASGAASKAAGNASGIVCFIGVGAATGGLFNVVFGFTAAAMFHPEELTPGGALWMFGTAFAGGALSGVSYGATGSGVAGALFKGMKPSEASAQWQGLLRLLRQDPWS
jgi:RHS repeat-associated protein/uncharacterized repeat protein (TIGR01451 family)